jgi:uncharacterized protein YbjT (DUF2867 family)
LYRKGSRNSARREHLIRFDRRREVEDAAVASGLGWVSLRASSFAIDTLQASGAQIRAGVLGPRPYAIFAEVSIHERDLAGVGARSAQR